MLKLNNLFKEKKLKYLLILVVIFSIITISFICWYFLIREDEFKVVVLNLSGEEIMVVVSAINSVNDRTNFIDEQFTGNGLGNDSGYTMVFSTTYTDFYLMVETRTNEPIGDTIAQTYYHYNTTILYDMVVIIQDSGKNITLTRMPLL